MFQISQFYSYSSGIIKQQNLNEQVKKQCNICNQKLKQCQFTKLCTCQHQFCKDCLKYYTLHKIRNEFVIIQCPKDNCNQKINKQSQIYLNLPENLKLRYQRIMVNLKALSNPSFKICPQCQDNQLNKLQGQDNLFCIKCVQKFCPICLNPAHKKYAKCDNAVIGMLKRHFQFKRCINCMFIVQKNQGCNHMTCRCGFQFCYLCGGDWRQGNHQCPPKPIYVRPRSVVIKKREFPERKVLTLAANNIVFNPQVKKQTQIKGNRPQKFYKILFSLNRKQNIKSESIIFQNNSFLINNVSVLYQKQQ